jgi:transcriptional regulator with XRE-family HTH domain
MVKYDEQYQLSYNGLLQSGFRAHMDEVRRKKKMTLAEFGQAIGISGAFAGNIINGKKAIRTKHILGILQALKALESGYQTDTDVQGASAKASPKERRLLDEASLEELARRANTLGFNVSFTQLP